MPTFATNVNVEHNVSLVFFFYLGVKAWSDLTESISTYK